MKNIIDLIEQILNNIICYDINEFNKNVTKLVEQIIIYLAEIDKGKLNEINKILYYMNIALDNKDYVLYGDVLQYELRPFIQNE